MLDLKQIESFYPEPLRVFKRHLLREYLQYKILEGIFDSKFGEGLSFMGGTATRIIHSSSRFSQDLDFDNLGLRERAFKQLAGSIQKKLEREGYRVETDTVLKGAYRCAIKILHLLFESGLSRHREEKLTIQLDAEPQRFTYTPEKVIINKFDVFLRINAVPSDILASQKIFAIFNRRRPMGRDFYDLVFLLGKTLPNFDYLKARLEIRNMADLKERLLARCEELSFKDLARDVEPFLPLSSDSKKVLFFCDYISGLP